MVPKILIVESDSNSRLNIAQHLRQQSLQVFEADQNTDALKILANQDVDVVLLGLEGLRQEGLSLIRIIKRITPSTEVITVNGPQYMDLSIEAMKLGAFDDFLIPFELESLIGSLRRACRKTRRRRLKDFP